MGSCQSLPSPITTGISKDGTIDSDEKIAHSNVDVKEQERTHSEQVVLASHDEEVVVIDDLMLAVSKNGKIDPEQKSAHSCADKDHEITKSEQEVLARGATPKPKNGGVNPDVSKDDTIISEEKNANSNCDKTQERKNSEHILVRYDEEEVAVTNDISNKQANSSTIESESKTEDNILMSSVIPLDLCPSQISIEDVYIGVHTGPILGKGISGLARMVQQRTTGVNYAVKCIDLSLVETEEEMQQLREEIFIMCQLDHPNIVRLEEVYESEEEIYLVEELCNGGELFDRLDDQPDYHYTEQECARLVKQMLCAVRYIHSKGIIHRDLKLENFLFSSRAANSELKLIDFGLSKHFTQGEFMKIPVGTPYTVAPEVILGNYNEKCDVWAIGVITYLLLSGDSPFGGCGGPESLLTVRNNILNGAYSFPEEFWAHASKDAKDFIRTLLVTDPTERPTAVQAQNTPWIQYWTNNQTKSRNNMRVGRIDANIIRSLVKFKEYSDVKKLLCAVLSVTLLPDQIRNLRAAFDSIDVDGTGGIELNDFKRVLMTHNSDDPTITITETEVEEIFDAVHMFKVESSIQWKEFIAASLGHCKVDDHNVLLAFNRLDTKHRGYISFDDILNLSGNENDATASSSSFATDKQSLLALYQKSCKDVDINKISYKDFSSMMNESELFEETPGMEKRIIPMRRNT